MVAASLAVSVVLHAAVLLLWRGEPVPPPGSGPAAEPASASAPRPESAMRVVEVRTADRAGAERGRPTVARLPEAESRSVTEPARPRAPGLALEPVPAPAPAGPSLAVGAASGGDGAGRAGEPGRISPPVPRTLLPQWDPPASVRGTRVTAHVEVDRDGRPTGEVRLEPPTESGDFNRRLREVLTSLRFRPARRAGEPVVAWAEITFVF